MLGGCSALEGVTPDGVYRAVDNVAHEIAHEGLLQDGVQWDELAKLAAAIAAGLFGGGAGLYGVHRVRNGRKTGPPV